MSVKPASEQWVLRDINFDINSGEAIGIAYQLFDDLADGDYILDELETSRLAEKYYHDALKYAQGFPELETLIRTIL